MFGTKIKLPREEVKSLEFCRNLNENQALLQ